MINIEWDSAYNDDEVILTGESGGASITRENLTDWAGTIPYEILTNINTRVPRIYSGECAFLGPLLSHNQRYKEAQWELVYEGEG